MFNEPSENSSWRSDTAVVSGEAISIHRMVVCARSWGSSLTACPPAVQARTVRGVARGCALRPHPSAATSQVPAAASSAGAGAASESSVPVRNALGLLSRLLP
jgi:hypothetical protein